MRDRKYSSGGNAVVVLAVDDDKLFRKKLVIKSSDSSSGRLEREGHDKVTIAFKCADIKEYMMETVNQAADFADSGSFIHTKVETLIYLTDAGDNTRSLLM